MNLDLDLVIPIFVLSGGEQQRVTLVCLFLNPISIILVDETTGKVDKEKKIDMMNILKSFS